MLGHKPTVGSHLRVRVCTLLYDTHDRALPTAKHSAPLLFLSIITHIKIKKVTMKTIKIVLALIIQKIVFANASNDDIDANKALLKACMSPRGVDNVKLALGKVHRSNFIFFFIK